MVRTKYKGSVVVLMFCPAHRFNLKSKEGLADRKVPAQPLLYYNKEGKVTRYNLRKVRS